MFVTSVPLFTVMAHLSRRLMQRFLFQAEINEHPDHRGIEIRGGRIQEMSMALNLGLAFVNIVWGIQTRPC
jgi:DUF1365 family protein